MTLTRQDWIDFGGEPVTGVVPPRLLVRGGVALTGEQIAGVQHAYSLFRAIARLSLAPYFVENRTLSDGTRLRLESRNGIDVVYADPPTIPDLSQEPLHGIGIRFTDLSGNPITGWAKDGEAQPVILTSRKSGGWRATRVPKFIGGSRLWTNTARKRWLSTLSDPSGMKRAAFVYSMDQASLAEAGGVLPEWVATSSERIPLGTGTFATSGSFGKYLFSQNHTERLMTTASASVPFLTQAESGTYQHAVRVAGNQLLLQRAAVKHVKGLEQEDADLSADGVYLDVEISTAAPAGFSLTGNTGVSVHPDGKRVLCLAFATSGTKRNGRYVIATIGEEVTVAGFAHPQADLADPTATGSLVRNASTEYQLRVTRSLVPNPTSCTTDPNGGTMAVFTNLTEEVPKDIYTGGYKKVSKSAAGNYTGAWIATALNRLYYDTEGNTVAELYSVEQAYSIALNYAEATITDTGSAGAAYTGSVVRTVSDVRTLSDTEYVMLGGARLDVHVETGSINRAVNDTQNTTGSSTTGEWHFTFTGTHSVTDRQVLFYDSVNGVVVYYEETATGTVSADIHNPVNTPVVAADLTSSVSVAPTGKIKVARIVNGAFTTVFEEAIAVSLTSKNAQVGVTTITDAMWSIAWNVTTTDVSQSTNVARTASYTTTHGTGVFCTNGSGATEVREEYSVPVAWNDTQGSDTLTPKASTFKSLDIGWSTKSVTSKMILKHARDPVTLATIVSLRFDRASYDGGTSTAWIWAIDRHAVKRLDQIITLPENAKPMVGPANSLHTLVSI